MGVKSVLLAVCWQKGASVVYFDFLNIPILCAGGHQLFLGGYALICMSVSV